MTTPTTTSRTGGASLSHSEHYDAGAILRRAIEGREGDLGLAEVGLLEIENARATIGVILDSMEGTPTEGSDRHLALYAASCSLQNAASLISTAISRPAGREGVK